MAVEIGAFLLQRDLGYDGVAAGTGALRGHEAPGFGGPWLRLELFPAAAFTRGALAGAGLFATYGTSVGAETEDPAGGSLLPTDYTRLGAGVLWRSPPLGSLRIAVTPSISWQRLELAVSPAVPGLPDARLSGLKGALDLEIPAGARVAFLLGAGYVRWLEAEELIEGTVAFFPGGSAWAIDAEAGVAVRVARLLWVRLLAEVSRTRYSLDPDPSGTYVASGATDVYLGGRLALALRY